MWNPNRRLAISAIGKNVPVRRDHHGKRNCVTSTAAAEIFLRTVTAAAIFKVCTATAAAIFKFFFVCFENFLQTSSPYLASLMLVSGRS